MSEKLTLPKTEVLTKLLTDLFGKTISAKPSVPATGAQSISIYANESGETIAICACDLTLSANLGAALTLIPADAAKDDIKAGKLSDPLKENLHEVMNIVTRIFSVSGAKAKLKEIVHTPPAAPQAVVQIMQKPSSKLLIEMTIPGYTSGKFGIYLV